MINGRIASYDPAGADFVSMGDNQFPNAANAPKVPWETPGTMNHSWGYNRLDFQWKSFDQLLDALLTNAHHGGAITLNVGPMGNGSFQQAAKRRLQQFAAWMAINESALQPTARSPFPEGSLPDGIRATLGVDPAKPCFNLILLKPRPAGDLVIPQPLPVDKATAFRAMVLETREFLPVKTDAQGRLVITVSRGLEGIDHAVIRVASAATMPHLYEDGLPVEPVKPGKF